MTDYEPMFKEAWLSVTAASGTFNGAALSETTGLSHDDYPKWRGSGMWTCLCQQCNQEFPAKRRDAKYCNPNCRKTASRRKDQIERARMNIQTQIMFINRMVEKHPDLDVFASLQLDMIRRLLNVTIAVRTDNVKTNSRQ